MLKKKQNEEFKMGYAKLNIWIRDEKCRPLYPTRNLKLHFVDIKNCMGETVKIENIPAGEAHVEVEVPPGCYIVHGHLYMNGLNLFTDNAIAIVGCGQVACVDLIGPTVRTCVMRDAHAFTLAAKQANLPIRDVKITLQTIMAAARISPEEIAGEIQNKITLVKDDKEAKDVLDEYKATLDIIKSVKPQLQLD
jgi:hypothetical protein